MCALKSLLSWIICVQRKKSICTGLEFVRRSQKAISYLDHFCARKVGVFASYRNLDLKMNITKVFHAGLFAHLEISLPLATAI